MTIVYLVTNTISKKRYVGITSLSLHKRRYHHYFAAKYGSDLLFHKALRKYDQDAWVWEIKLNTNNPDEAKALEMSLIKEHDTCYNNGYNMTLGGDGLWGYKHKEETRQKISQANMGNKHCVGYKHTKEAKDNMRKAQLGRKHSEKTKIKMSNSMRGLKRSEQSKKNISKAQTGVRRTFPTPVEIVNTTTGLKELPKSLKLWCQEQGYKYTTVYMSVKRTGRYKMYSITHRS